MTKSTTGKSLSERDKQCIWHPLTQHKKIGELPVLTGARGALLFEENGQEYVDGIASWYTSIYGHCNEKITSRVARQMTQLDQVVFSGFTHPPAVELAESLLRILPAGQDKVFFNDNGSTATEVGIKMALQYHHNRQADRKIMLAFENGFHGDTFGAMSVSGLSVYNGAFEDHFIEVQRIPVPDGQNNEKVLQRLENLMEEYAFAGFIYEPLVQGAAGMKMYDQKGLDQILKMCKKNNILCIADEVMTGFGKTGKNFASDYLETPPDIVCLSKALTAGVVPMGATTCTNEVYHAFYSDEIAKGLFHGHTYTANPIACTAALAGIDLLLSEEMQNAIQEISKAHEEFRSRIADHPKVRGLRQLGTIVAFELEVEMERYGQLRNQLYQQFMEDGVFLRPLGNTLYVSPPYVITSNQLDRIYSSLIRVLDLF